MKLTIAAQALVVLLVGGVLVVLGVKGALESASVARSAAPLPVLFSVPPFRFQERSGRSVGLEDLRGRVWIADFIFTNCAGTCPTMTAQMRRLQEALAAEDGVFPPRSPRGDGRALLVSFTVDPERDTEEALSTYAAGVGAGKSWLFLRGPAGEVRRLSREGFRLGTAPADPTAPGTEPIAHDRHFVLVDAEGRIRGYYDGIDPEAVEPLTRDARTLLSATVAVP